MNALGHATVGLTAVAGEYLVPLPTSSCQGSFSLQSDFFATVPMSGISEADFSFGTMGLMQTVPFSGEAEGVFSVEMQRIVRYAWEAALLIDIIDEPSYPLIVVSEAVEPVPTNTISIRSI